MSYVRTQHEGQTRGIPETVFFTGTTAIKEGDPVCWDRDYYTSTSGQAVTDAWPARTRMVALPSTSNNLAFAGVAAGSSSANANGQNIDIYPPGSVVKVACEVSTTINSTLLTACVNTGCKRFALQGLDGKGSALALQTVANASDTTTNGPVCQSFTGSGSCTSAGVLTDSGKFTYAAAGDRVIVLGGATSTGDSSVVTLGEYVISSADSADQITLTSAPCTSTALLTYYVVRGYPKVLAELMDGPESGLCEVLTANDDAASQFMVGGTTLLAGGFAIDTANSTATLADGTRYGMRKAFCAIGSMDTGGADKDYVVTVTSGIDEDLTTAVASIAFDAVGEQAVFEWCGNFGGDANGLWVLRYLYGATTASS